MATTVVGLLSLLVFLLLFEAWLASRNALVSFQNPTSAPVHIKGNGPPLRYVVMGDSTTAGRGAAPENSITMGTARHLAEKYDVTLINLSASGARMKDLLAKQLPEAKQAKPDVVLLSVGANDIVHFTPDGQIKSDLHRIIAELIESNPKISIVVPGSGEVGACPRFEQPLRLVAGWQTKRVNDIIKSTALACPGTTWIPLAERTGELFGRDPTLFSQDRFHPNDRGYYIWTQVLDEGLDQMMRSRHN
ncbi:MAG: SGNH/GDSL hydrolase family protein [Candidatus Melainabacteria bacterium]|nr:SGNH/GDSL hydrolase family protein [Candidatus Melainabacteria bacterium]